MNKMNFFLAQYPFADQILLSSRSFCNGRAKKPMEQTLDRHIKKYMGSSSTTTRGNGMILF